jgi:hypothetical protein
MWPWVTMLATSCYYPPVQPPRSTGVEPAERDASRSDQLANELVVTAETVARSGDCAAAAKLGPVIAHTSRRVYERAYLGRSEIQRCIAAPALPAPGPTVANAPPPSAAAPSSSPYSPMSAQRRFALGTFVAGVSTVAIGTWAGLDARSKRDSAQAMGCSPDLSLCPAAALPTARAAYARGSLSTNLFIGGAALIGTAAIIWFTAPKQVDDHASWHVSPVIDPHQIGMSVGHAL